MRCEQYVARRHAKSDTSSSSAIVMEPVGGLYRKVVIGKEQSHRTSFMTGHLLWQDRLRVEQQQRDKQLSSWHKKLGLHPPGLASPEEGGQLFETRMARDRLLWQDSQGPGSRNPDLETLAGRREAERQGRLRLKIMRGLASSTSEPSLRHAEPDAGPSSRAAAEVALRHHEVCHRQAHAPLDQPSPLSDPEQLVLSGRYPDGVGGNRLVAEVPLRDHEIVCRQHRRAKQL